MTQQAGKQRGQSPSPSFPAALFTLPNFSPADSLQGFVHHCLNAWEMRSNPMLWYGECYYSTSTARSFLQSLFEDSTQRSYRSLRLSSSWLFIFIHFCNIKTTHSLIRLPVPRGRHHSLNCRRKLNHLRYRRRREDMENGICEPRTLERTPGVNHGQGQ